MIGLENHFTIKPKVGLSEKTVGWVNLLLWVQNLIFHILSIWVIFEALNVCPTPIKIISVRFVSNSIVYKTYNTLLNLIFVRRMGQPYLSINSLFVNPVHSYSKSLEPSKL